jgi:hypothetical protein
MNDLIQLDFDTASDFQEPCSSSNLPSGPLKPKAVIFNEAPFLNVAAGQPCPPPCLRF